VFAFDPARPKILLHARALTTKNPCGTVASPILANCANAVITGSLNPTFYHVHLLVAPGDTLPTQNGLGGIELGLTYQNGSGSAGDGIGFDVFQWNLCATLEFPTTMPAWPNPLSGTLITWQQSECETVDVVTAGYFYSGAYGDDTFRVIQRPNSGLAKVANCSGIETVLATTELGFFGFGAATGCNPCLMDCGGVPVRPTTWGAIKSLYSNER
jgi:hypothetical protein